MTHSDNQQSHQQNNSQCYFTPYPISSLAGIREIHKIDQYSNPSVLDTAITAQALLAYFEGVMLLAKGRNDPALIQTLRMGGTFCDAVSSNTPARVIFCFNYVLLGTQLPVVARHKLSFSPVNGVVFPELCSTPPVKTLLDNLFHYWDEKQARIDIRTCFLHALPTL